MMHVNRDRIKLEEPILVVNKTTGVCRVTPEGKKCTTEFEKISYDADSNTSLVYCMPHTGRMHQIRVHLQWLGHPIANDPLYGDLLDNLEQGENSEKKQKDDSKQQGTLTEYVDYRPSPKQAVSSEDNELVPPMRQQMGDRATSRCTECNQDLTLFRDPTEEELCLWLHAYSYELRDRWVYTTEMPLWAHKI